MKRRDLILASAGILLPALGRAAQPCPPPQVTVSGGNSATTDCVTVTGSSYSTSFDLTENPITEGGKWVNGQSTGLQWSNVQTGSGNAYASRLVDSGGVCRYCDPIAHLSASFMAFSPNQYAQGTVYRVLGYQNPNGGHEIELLLRFQITANNARGYEVLWGQGGTIAIVRWNGGVGDYSDLTPYATGPNYSRPAVDGDVLRAEISGNTLVVKVNSSTVLTLDVSSGGALATVNSGQPGIGFWPTPGSTLSSYGWKSFNAGSL